MIKKEEVEHIAKLARIGLTSKEIGELQKELSTILDYVDKLKKKDISGIKPMSHSVLVENVMREDKTDESLPNKREKLLKLTPDRKEDFLKVKSIL